MRVHVPADELDVAVPIPAGARTLAIYDKTSSPWTWQLGEPALERMGHLALIGGQFFETALAPSFTHVAPANRYPEDRDVLLVFGVDL